MKAKLAVMVYCPGNCGTVLTAVSDYLTCYCLGCEYHGEWFKLPVIDLEWVNPTDPRHELPTAIDGGALEEGE